MAYNSWEDIFRSKSTEELYKTLKGYNNSTFNQKKLALKILTERDFDFDKIDKHVKNWKAESQGKKKQFKRTYPVLSFIDEKIGYILSILAVLLLFFTTPTTIFKDIKELPDEIKLFVISWIGSLSVAIIFGIYIQLRINRKKKENCA